VEEDARVADAACAAASALHERMRGNLGPTLQAAAVMREALRDGRKILVFGNGGSASDAQHFAAELVGRFQRERKALPSLALTTDTSVLTALANDYAFERVYARQVEAFGQPGDVALGITTSGDSPNVVVALQTARTQGLKTIALTGRTGGSAASAAEIHVNVPDQSTARVQEVHRTLLHIMCELVENGLREPENPRT
jgi:D-sedoheptulose 7-phosphate isomerase